MAPAFALAFLLWTDGTRLRHVERVSDIQGAGAQADLRSPTGYAGGKRWLIVPEHDNGTYQWIEETQEMLARGDFRVRSASYENAPFGRDVHAASPYRWWLVAVGWAGHAVTGRSLGLWMERAVLYADPLVHALLVLSVAALAAARFGPLCAALLSLGLVGFFPLCAAFLPGIASDFGLGQALALASILPVLAGTLAPRERPGWHILGGVAAGCGLWVSAMTQVPVTAGVALGAILSTGFLRTRAQAPSGPPVMPPWRAWALAGALTSLLGYLVEYFPGRMGFELRVNYPLYGLAWIGLGELLVILEAWVRGEAPLRKTRGRVIGVLSVAALGALPWALLRGGGHSPLIDDLHGFRLCNLPDAPAAQSLRAWLGSGDARGTLSATLLPLVLLVPAAWQMFRSGADAGRRAALALAFGPVAVTLALALGHLRGWSTLDVALLGIVAASTARGPALPRGLAWIWAGLVAGAVACGLAQLAPSIHGGEESPLRYTRAEVEGLYERDLAHWIADRAGPRGATVLVPPFRTSSFCFYGGLRGIGTQNWENAAGLAATFRIMTSTQPDECLSQIGERGVDFIVLPSWDTDFDDFARMRLKVPEASFAFALKGTLGGVFNWLRPLPYKVPPLAGITGESVLIFRVTDEADPATLQGRLVEYLIEMHETGAAALAGQALLRYPSDVGCMVAQAQLAAAQGDRAGFAKALRAIVPNLSNGADRNLAWDRRVSLSVVMAIGGRADLSRAQLARCLADADPEKIRALTTESLYHLLVLAKRFHLEVPGPGVQELAIGLLPSDLRTRL